MSRAVLLRADAARTERDPLAAAASILARATEQGRGLSLHERATVRAHVREYESESGESLLAECDRIAARAHGPVMDASDREALRLRLDVLEALTG